VKAVILAGGLGTRLREETEFRPKPMVEIGGKPILWHIMKSLNAQGINEFVICLGYKGEQIKEFFLNYEALTNDITIHLGDSGIKNQFHSAAKENWNVTLADTGMHTMTGGRLNLVRQYLGSETFLCTYGDGLADVNVNELINFHKKHNGLATVTAVQPTNRFGALELNEDNVVTSFAEKPISEEWVNGGFFIFEKEIFEYLDNECILEREPLEEVARKGELHAYKHKGFWRPMDTHREAQELNKLWSEGIAPWRNW
jgi:glucose-1-phosphate cytidylyltransferase